MPALHKPTDTSRAEVASLVSFGVTQEDIAKYIGICVDTLSLHYRHELDTALIKANGQIANKLFSSAMDGDTKAMMFWLKSRARWRQTDAVDDKNMDLKSIVEKLIDKLAD